MSASLKGTTSPAFPCWTNVAKPRIRVGRGVGCARGRIANGLPPIRSAAALRAGSGEGEGGITDAAPAAGVSLLKPTEEAEVTHTHA